jgi:hypothetical protein
LPSFESQLGFRCLCVRIFLCSSFLDLAQCRSREIIDLAPGRSQSSALIREQGSPAQALTLPQPVRFLCSPDFMSPLAPLVFPRQSVSLISGPRAGVPSPFSWPSAPLASSFSAAYLRVPLGVYRSRRTGRRLFLVLVRQPLLRFGLQDSDPSRGAVPVSS